MKTPLASLSLLLLLSPACGGGSAGPDAGDLDAVAIDADDTDGPVDPLGFELRIPELHHVTCSSYPEGFPEEPQDWTDTDWLCTLQRGSLSAYVYVQSTPVDCEWSMMPYPQYQTGVAQISVDGAISPLADAEYYWGGNHHIDTLSLTYDGLRYVYDHSSLGLGYRPCQDVDCMRVYDGEDLLEDGCTSERTLPVVCVQIDQSGGHAELVDQFEPCPTE